MYACQIFSVVSDSCPVIDSRSPDSSVRGTLQARMCADCAVMSDFATPWTVAYQAPQSMEFPRREYWSVLPFPSPGDLPDWGIKPKSPAFQADSLPSRLQGSPKNWDFPSIPRQEYWSGLPCPPGSSWLRALTTTSLMSRGLAGGFFTTSATWEAHEDYNWLIAIFTCVKIFRALHSSLESPTSGQMPRELNLLENKAIQRARKIL